MYNDSLMIEHVTLDADVKLVADASNSSIGITAREEAAVLLLDDVPAPPAGTTTDRDVNSYSGSLGLMWRMGCEFAFPFS